MTTLLNSSGVSLFCVAQQQISQSLEGRFINLNKLQLSCKIRTCDYVQAPLCAKLHKVLAHGTVPVIESQLLFIHNLQIFLGKATCKGHRGELLQKSKRRPNSFVTNGLWPRRWQCSVSVGGGCLPRRRPFSSMPRLRDWQSRRARFSSTGSLNQE